VSESGSTRAPRRRGRSAWAERLLLGVGAVLVVAGLLTIPLRRLATDPTHRGITGRVLEELEPTDRIASEPGALRGFNLLLITTDTTRSDHLSAYGNQSVHMPVLDSLARQGVLCANASTPSPSTLPAHSSLLTGLYPLHHGARANGTFRLDPSVTTLAERLRVRGYRTGAVISAFVLDSRFGLDQGFDHYDDDLTRGIKLSAHMFRERAAELSNDPAVSWLRQDPSRPFFLWVHYFDPHAAYLPPEPFRSEYADDLYDGELAYADSQIGALLGALEDLGLRERTLVVYTSDHGEGLGDHGEQTHSLLTYEPTLHVPLVFHAAAALPRGKRLDRPVSLVDVVPTALSLLGEPVPEGLDGLDLTRPVPEARVLYFETIATMTLHGWAPLMGVRRGTHKFILAPEPELYDLASDPRERDNRYARDRELARELERALVEIVGGDPLIAAQVVGNLELDDEGRRQLEALGYVGTLSGEGDREWSARDPKHMIHHWEKVQHAIHLRTLGRVSEALPLLEEAVDAVESDLFARNVLAGTYQMRGEHEEALALLRRSQELEPHDAGIPLQIASVQLALGRFDETEAALHRALEIDPQSAPAYLQKGQLALYREGDERAALEFFERARDMDPGSTGPDAYNRIGQLHLRANRLDAAREAFDAAIAIDGLNGAARTGLAEIRIAERSFDEAAGLLVQALRFDPAQPYALATLASLRSRKGEHGEALDLVNRALEISPRYPDAHNALGLIYRRSGDLERAEAHYRKALEYGPYLDKAHVNLAQLHVRRGERAEAMQEFAQALRVNPWSRVALANLGANHFNEGRIDQALAFYLRALEVDPDYALVHKQIASIYVMREQPALAAHHLRRSLEIDPEQGDAAELRHLLAQIEDGTHAPSGAN
jgi:arylsulfatase A-like enzyme/Tfp pilus assembly protein PilF